ncbi:DUF4148 domain-containing protein [Noviherbaspirillum suwonense]|uniref:DUF4148 domain-containing protein n=1 Tax=Noviherbaspirillum suwonense TaxID=1224511 RepID=UPI0024B85CD5|nr:DUF4148 domain-containing protein [Noviherbaspirillum suwonense]
MKPINMSSVVILTAALAAFSTGALASDVPDVQSARGVNQWQDMTGIKSTKTRAEVRSELSQGQAKGTSGQQEYVEFSKVAVPDGTSRANVKSELGKSSANTVLQPNDIYYGG